MPPNGRYFVQLLPGNFQSTLEQGKKNKRNKKKSKLGKKRQGQ